MFELLITNDFWIGILGAVIGGVFSILGVYLTMKNQRKLDQEQRQIEKMPILKVSVEQVSFDEETDKDCSFLGISGKEIFTSVNPSLFTAAFR